MGRQTMGLGGVKQHEADLEKQSRSSDASSSNVGSVRLSKKRGSSVSDSTQIDHDVSDGPTSSVSSQDVKIWQQYIHSMIAENKISATNIQAMAELNTSAGGEGLEHIQDVGSFGRWKENCNRDLRRKLRRRSAMPKPYLVKVRCHNPDTRPPV